MKNISICIIDSDSDFQNAFINAVILDFRGINISALKFDSSMSPLSSREIVEHDIFLISDSIELDDSFLNSYISKILFLSDTEHNNSEGLNCMYRFSGVENIISTAKQMILSNRLLLIDETTTKNLDFHPLDDEGLILFFSLSGGVGVSSAAIGVGRELARYRDKKTMYISLEDFENNNLCTSEIFFTNSQEQFLYQFFRFLNSGLASEIIQSIIIDSVGVDEYGLYRLKPDTGVNSFSTLDITSLLAVLYKIKSVLNLDFLILDFGTRIGFLAKFLEVFDSFCICIVDGEERALEESEIFNLVGGSTNNKMCFSIPNCHEDFIKTGKDIEISLSSEFGSAMKKLCDKILTCDEEVFVVSQ